MSTIQELDALVKTAQFEKVRNVLKTFKVNKMAREEMASLANIANRVGMPLFALKSLSTIFREGNLRKATPQEIIQYGHALRRLGAADEAFQIFANVDVKSFPEVLLQMAICQAVLWNYSEAVPLLRQYLATIDADSYTWVVANINLLAALIYVEDSGAVEERIQELSGRMSAERMPLLFGNFLELQARWSIQKGDTQGAADLAERARTLMSAASGTWDALQAEKWIAVARSLELGRVAPELGDIRSRAIRSGQWEVVRDCDFYIGKIAEDERLLSWLYYGSPFSSFRKKIRGILKADLPETRVWPQQEAKVQIDLRSGLVNGQDKGLKLGQAVHRLLVLLASDFYKPFTMVTLFAKITGNAYFDPVNSPNRVHQTMTRFRRFVKTSGLGLEIEPIGGSFRLQATSPDAGVIVPRDPVHLDSRALKLSEAKPRLENEFTAEEMTSVLGHSLSSTLRLLRYGQESGQVKPIGAGHNRKYRFVA